MIKKAKKASLAISVSLGELQLTEAQIKALHKKLATAFVDVMEKDAIVPHFEFFAIRPPRKQR